jgi:UDP-GlcNAc:undecaprenyl-phosphate/decaprenyl-phosphate GlcNAc-1-phosphate transferase
MLIQSFILIASITTFIAIIILRPVALSIGLIDNPNERKLHTGSVPLIGGLAMFFGITVSILLLPGNLNHFNYFLLSSLILVSIGVMDDHRDISVSLRLIFQALVAIIIVSGADMSIKSFGNILGEGEIFLGGWSYALTMIAIIAAINAVNMADGIHGLAASNSLVTFGSILLLSIGALSNVNLWIAILFCSVLPVFLIYNLCIGISKRKRIFMGDAGSMFIGLGIIWLLLDLSQGKNYIFSPVIALWIFATPIIDMVSSIFRRIASGRSPFKPDVFHIHHLLLHLGIKEKSALLIVILFSMLMAIIGVLGDLYQIAEWIMFAGFIAVFIIYIFWSKWAMLVIKKI